MLLRRAALLAFIATLIALLPILAPLTLSQEARGPSSPAGSPAERTLGEEPGSSPETPNPEWSQYLQGLWQACGPFAYPIASVFVLGVFLALDQARLLLLDKLRSRAILAKDLRQLTAAEHRLLLASVKSSRLVALLRTIHALKQVNTPDQEVKGEIHRRINFLEGKFSSFLAWMEFLSESEGALGLLGTVAGIYAAFTTEALSSANTMQLIKYLGLALATTYLGLVASLVLNFLTTQVFNMQNQGMVIMSEKGEEYLAAIDSFGSEKG